MTIKRITKCLLGATRLAFAAIVVLGCDDTPGTTEPTTGALKITVATVGAIIDRDPDGYTLSIDGAPTLVLSSNAAVTIPTLAPGRHMILLDGLAPNCSVDGLNPRSVDIGGRGNTAAVEAAFVVTCKAKTGTVNVSVVTSGPDPDPNGYSVDIGPRRGDIATNGARSFPDVREGSYEVLLSDLAGNCVVDGPNPLRVNVSFGVNVEAGFSIRCVKSASLVVTTATTGVDLDPDGYLLVLRGDGASAYATATASVNGTTTFPALLPGSYLLTISGIMLNCNIVPPISRTVTVNVESATRVALEVTCETPTQLAFVRGSGNSAEIYSVNSNGSGVTNLTDSPGPDVDPDWSPPGNKIAFASDRGGNREIFVMNANGANPVRLTNSVAADYRPAWSPDGNSIAFVSERDGNAEIYVMNADGTNPVRLTNRAGYDTDPTWSADGKKLAFAADRDGNGGIWTMNADGSGVVRLTTSGLRDRQPAWSPDGTSIVFSREVSTSTSALFVINADGSSLTRLTENLYIAADPTWSPDGRKVAFGGLESYDFYYSFESYMIVIGIDGESYSAPSPTGMAVSNPAWRPR